MCLVKQAGCGIRSACGEIGVWYDIHGEREELEFEFGCEVYLG